MGGREKLQTDSRRKLRLVGIMTPAVRVQLLTVSVLETFKRLIPVARSVEANTEFS
jgi:hypothetical protein